MVNSETLLYIIKNNKVLLILKKTGLGKGLYNGVGGKLEPGEDPLKAAIRETQEEIGVTPKDVEWAGLLEFHNNGALYGFVHVFIASDYEGEPTESREAKPIWFPLDKIPFDKMWEDDRFWLPKILIERKKIYGRFYFENDWRFLVKSEIYELKPVLKK